MHPEIETFKEEFKKICDIKVGDVFLRPAKSPKSSDRIYEVVFITEFAIIFNVFIDGVITNTSLMPKNEDSIRFFTNLVQKGSEIKPVVDSFKLAKIMVDIKKVNDKAADAKKLLSEYDDKLAILNNEMNLLKQNL